MDYSLLLITEKNPDYKDESSLIHTVDSKEADPSSREDINGKLMMSVIPEEEGGEDDTSAMMGATLITDKAQSRVIHQSVKLGASNSQANSRDDLNIQSNQHE